MFIPEITEEDLLIIPENYVDIKIWINNSIESLGETQPLFCSYLRQLLKTKDQEHCFIAMYSYLVIEHALKRDVGCA